MDLSNLKGTYGVSSSDIYGGADLLTVLETHSKILKWILKQAWGPEEESQDGGTVLAFASIM